MDNINGVIAGNRNPGECGLYHYLLFNSYRDYSSISRLDIADEIKRDPSREVDIRKDHTRIESLKGGWLRVLDDFKALQPAVDRVQLDIALKTGKECRDIPVLMRSVYTPVPPLPLPFNFGEVIPASIRNYETSPPRLNIDWLKNLLAPG